VPAARADSQLAAAWTATDGFSDKNFISFEESAYAAMRDDEGRTPIFEKAIQKRLAGQEGKLTVLEIGTGPYALLAIIAARAGAKKVYAIEAQPEAAKRARQAVKKAGFEDTIEVLDGFSTAVELPEKADVVVAEIVGSVASEEGMIATIRDAQARLVKQPELASSWIPNRCQTLAAPATYALHYALGPPQFDWTKLKEPVRLNCRDETLQTLAEPQLLEDISFADLSLPASGTWRPQAAPASFVVSAERIEANQGKYYAELRKEGAKEDEARQLSVAVAHSLSGLALWPRLLMDEEASLVVDSRGPRGEHRKSHWQTVLPLLSARPQPVDAGDTVVLRAAVELGRGVAEPPRYSLQGEIVPNPSR
jgi:protein arginine N-methyltransferase 1